MSQNKTIIIAEDNPRDRDFLSNLVHCSELLITSNGREALEVSAAFAEPLVISDLQMPEMGGIDFARALWQQKPGSRIVFWSQYRDEIYVRSLAGLIPPDTVYGFVLKDNPADVVEKAINAVFDDCQCWIDPNIRSVQARLARPQGHITEAEYEVLIDIALGLTDNAIANRHYLSRRGVQNRLRSLYSKLEVDQTPHIDIPIGDTLNLRSRAVSIALRRGLINTEAIEEEEALLQQWLQHRR